MKKVLLTATVQSHICQFHKPLVEVLHEDGFEVHVAARNNLNEKNGLELDFVEKVYDVPFSRSPKSLKNIDAYRQLRDILKRERYEIIHCNTPMGGIVTRLAAINTGARIYYTAHGFHFYHGAPKKNWVIFYPIENVFSKITDKIITINKEDYLFAQRKWGTKSYYMHGVGVDKNRYTPITGKEKRELRSSLGYSEDQNIILCVGELLPNKNQKMAIRVIEKLCLVYPKIKLLIAGNGPQKACLEQQVHEAGVEENVEFLGYCTNLEVYQAISDVLVACSRREGLGLNVIEAMLAENPVVAVKNRGHCELVSDGYNGFLVEQDDAEKMAERVQEIFKNKDLSDFLGKNARQYALQYSNEAVKEEIRKIYRG